MNKTTTIVIVILALAVLFLAYTVISSNSGVPISSYPIGQYAGGGCGI